MRIVCRAMREGEEDVVAEMVRQLPKDIGISVVPELTGDVLRRDADLLNVIVAEDAGRIFGIVTWTLIYSSWRGARGVYICDLFVTGQMRGKRLGEALIAAAAREAAKRGAVFMKLEADVNNLAGLRFYERLGFSRKPDDVLHFLEPDAFRLLSEG
jgi:ribosomal protein S18 acetylase RimI-like enzyme